MEKIEGKFWFDNAYIDSKGQDQNAIVVLVINYRTKSYSITPYCGTQDFAFRESSHKWQMWKAIINSINDAIDFANKEIHNT